MGQLLNLKCEKCGYETNLGIGAGIRFNDIEMVIGFFGKDIQDRIREAIKENGNKFWYAYKEIGVCEKCGKISAVAVVKITVAEGKELVFKAKCPCGGEVELVPAEEVVEGKRKLFCQVCEEEMVVTVNGNWD